MFKGITKVEIFYEKKLKLSVSAGDSNDYKISEMLNEDIIYKIYYCGIGELIKLTNVNKLVKIELIENKNYIIKVDTNEERFLFKKLINIVNDENGYILGMFNSNNYVGEISLNDIGLTSCNLKIVSTKIDYYKDFWKLIDDLSEIDSELSVETNSIFEEEYMKNGKVDYDSIRYSTIIFILSLLEDNKIPSWVQRIIKSPKTNLGEYHNETNIWECGEVTIDDISDSSEIRFKHNTRGNLYNLPVRVNQSINEDTIDNMENYFVKFFLEHIKSILEIVLNSKNEMIKEKCLVGIDKINSILNQEFFFKISPKNYIAFNSQVLQKRYPYNNLFNSYNKLSLLAELNTNIYDDFINLGQKNVPLLYEYWTFIQVYNVMKENFQIKEKREFIATNKEKLTLNISKSNFIKTIFSIDESIYVELYYNKLYKRDEKDGTGSYSHSLQPDISLEFYKNNNIVGIINFDAKYKLKDDLSTKEEDLNKMHAYNDAIKMTIASIVLYPGKQEEIYEKYKSRNNGKINFPCIGAIPLIISEKNKGLKLIEKIIIDYINDLKN